MKHFFTYTVTWFDYKVINNQHRTEHDVLQGFPAEDGCTKFQLRSTDGVQCPIVLPVCVLGGRRRCVSQPPKGVGCWCRGRDHNRPTDSGAFACCFGRLCENKAVCVIWCVSQLAKSLNVHSTGKRVRWVKWTPWTLICSDFCPLCLWVVSIVQKWLPMRRR